ncbi:major facilitator superfamily domain-containing protein [Aspergillus bertholletiae]|uniref:Major facilitator superfamily domain-containing protein n=1 Tax=Aspergillus bertholletiae TaxID=1226010 RepID=A0A5N7BNA1_9EURO|nr:major facilitator superfamily domain-containing protein [Aspergillus bertholletiae]
MGGDTEVVYVESLPTNIGGMQGEKEARYPEDLEWVTAQKRYLRKLDYIILPTISALYFFEYLDRGNIANAKLYGYNQGHNTFHHGVGPGDEKLSSTQWQLVVMIFYVGLVLFQVPGCIGYRVFPPSKWIAFGVCGWAVTSMLQCTAFNLAGALVCRIFIGVFEGLFGTGIVYYLSLWYHRTEMGMRVFWFLGPTAVAGAFGGLIAFGIGHIEGSVPNWKWLFLIEALPCFCLGLFCLYWLPDRPTANSRFSGQDQEIAETRYKNESFDKAGKIQKKHVLWVFTDWRLYVQAAVYLPTAALLSSISGFLPTIISNLGYSKPATANLMTVPPYAVAFALMLATSYSSDRFKERGIHITILMVVATIAYALLATLPEHQLKGKYACVCIAVACVYATYPPSHAWAANNFGNETKRAIGMGFYTALGNLGSIAGSWFYPSNEGPEFRKGHFICMGLAIATAVISLGNSLILRALNNYRDRKYGKPEAGVAVDVTELADNSPMFRFIT